MTHLGIAFFGSSLVSAYWNGAATYYRGIVRALHERGHRVCFYEPDAYERQKHRDIPDPDYARVVVYPATEDAVERALREDASLRHAVALSGRETILARHTCAHRADELLRICAELGISAALPGHRRASA